jgi:ubiquinone/menaquinone biosynthesis C-methylase UbiE
VPENKQLEHWVLHANESDETYQEWLRRWTWEFFSLIKELTRNDLVTVNVGGGPVPFRFPKENVKEEILLDNNAEWFDIYPKKYREGMRILNENIEETTLPDLYADLCYCRKTLECIENWKEALTQMHRILKADGLLILIFHTNQNDKVNLNLLTMEGVMDYLEQLGFSILFQGRNNITTYVQLLATKKTVIEDAK